MNDKKNNGNNLKKARLKKMGGYSAYIYLALAICIVTALTIGIFTMSYDFSDVSTPQISIPEISLPDESIPQASEAPVGGEESNVDDVINTQPSFVLPVANGTVIKNFSVDALVFSTTMQDYRVHKGVDIAAELGTPVVSYAAGTITQILDDPFYGTTVVIEHSTGVTTYYKNLAEELPEGVTVGTAVKAGDTIGIIGATARVEKSDQAHLHFEMTVGGELIDPVPELNEIKN